MGLCDIHVIKEVLSRHGFHFSKSLGQNFLTAQWVPERIAAECGVDKNSCALEVGPGMGCLTNELSKQAEKVVAIELDRALFPVLEETLADCSNVEVVHGDVLKTDLSAICKEKFGDKKVFACANLPYYITTPAISALLDSKMFSGITVMVQKEVAKRICAKAGSSDYSAFSIYVQYYADAKILFDVPAGCFVPQPKVDSAVIRLNPLEQPSVAVKNEKLFFAIVRAAFNQRRKTLVNAISPAFGGRLDKADILSLMKTCNLDERIRGEKLTLEKYAKLSDVADDLLKSKS
ncbi:MAG TPA: 16S rRNA (adenine(1518)-N(6)/adenine(1519)-N(6))-dimethyltransferase RsmA [Candidatus Butyricicoccus avistercoris]|uniref:Ribosomal RNA small subunit methyltransferase A n=1 Tax=Candidatus Butyricicoccus avistercoris TaxID=2838518 RepID=A0A9D1PIV9_9FIRM|nr:16S rRNA (adenine(1518)-N(6)/adenine(1519)-N(6))-dimethyltransferase RsmA [Candidatus Butyricicoccus avistercoris]